MASGRPVGWLVAPLVLCGVALLFRLFDIFVLRLDEQLGEIILSKSLGFVLVLGYVWWAGQRPVGIGLHRRHFGTAVTIGAGITIFAFMVALVVQVITLPSGSSLDLAAVDPKTGLAGGAGFAAFLLLGNVVNSFMEEGLFRGVMLTHFLDRMRFWTANISQAALFSVWHLVWPIKSILTGDSSAGEVMAQTGSLMLGTFVAALVYGYLFWRTDSLWTPWIAHFLNNTTLNLVQVREASGELQPAVVMSIVVVVALALLAFALAPVSRQLKLPQLRPWTGGAARPDTGATICGRRS